MTRRIALAILLSVWGMLILGAGAAYFGVRAILLDDLDSLLEARTRALPELLHRGTPDITRDPPQYDWEDTYSVRPDPQRMGLRREARPVRVDAKSHFSGGRHLRTLTFRATSAEQQPVIVEYSGSMQRLDGQLSRVRVLLALFVIVAGALAGAVAAVAARIVLRPLQLTARTIAAIDERSLSVRIPLVGLPAEILPVALRLNELLDRLDRAFAAQRRFVSNASQELRAPVMGLCGTLEALSGPSGEAAADAQALARCAKQMQSLGALVDRMLEYAASDARFGAEVAGEVDVTEVIHDCAAAAEAIGGGRGVKLACAGPQALRCRLPGDRLRSVLMNVLANAVEHHDGAGTVELSWLHDSRQLRIRIADDGPGIASAHLPHVFDPFYRAAPGSAQARHLGLGLFIVDAHVKAMRGECRISSTPGKGSVVEVEIPCPRLAEDRPGPFIKPALPPEPAPAAEDDRPAITTPHDDLVLAQA